MHFHEDGHLLFLDEKESSGIMRVWWGCGIAVLHNNCKVRISLLHVDTHIQRSAHRKEDTAPCVSISEVGVAEQIHGGSGFATWSWNASWVRPVKTDVLLINQVIFLSLFLCLFVIVISLYLSVGVGEFWAFLPNCWKTCSKVPSWERKLTKMSYSMARMRSMCPFFFLLHLLFEKSVYTTVNSIVSLFCALQRWSLHEPSYQRSIG